MFLSMWISNTAATAMMVPIVDAIHAAVNTNDDDDEHEQDSKKVGTQIYFYFKGH